MIKRNINIKRLLDIGLYISAVGLCTYTFYVPYLYLRCISWKAIELYFETVNPTIVNSDIKKIAFLFAFYKVVFPLVLVGISFLVKRFLQMEKLAKICIISSGIGFSFTILFLLLTLFNFQFFVYNGGICVIIGWIFCFYASSPS